MRNSRVNPTIKVYNDPREITLDPEAEQILTSISEFRGGDADRALSELLKSAELIRKRDRAEQQFASGDTVSFEEVQRRMGL